MVEEEVVVDKLQYVNQYTSELKEIRRGLTKESYLDDLVTQRAVERTLMNVVQACIDTAQHIRATENLSPSGTGKLDMRALGEAGILDEKTQSKMEEAVGFRNTLAHRYGTIDHDIVYEVLQSDVQWFEAFQTEVAGWLQQYNS